MIDERGGCDVRWFADAERAHPDDDHECIRDADHDGMHICECGDVAPP